jgi:hypothetical protein
MLERITLEWLAGFFDGEGGIACYRTKSLPSKWTGIVHVRWKLKITLTQNDESLLDAIRTKFPEFKFSAPRLKPRGASKKQHWRPGYEITTDGGSCYAFLMAMRPLVIRKLLDVETALEFCETIHKFRLGKKRVVLTQEEHNIRLALAEKLKQGRVKDSIN